MNGWIRFYFSYTFYALSFFSWGPEIYRAIFSGFLCAQFQAPYRQRSHELSSLGTFEARCQVTAQVSGTPRISQVISHGLRGRAPTSIHLTQVRSVENKRVFAHSAHETLGVAELRDIRVLCSPYPSFGLSNSWESAHTLGQARCWASWNHGGKSSSLNY